MRTQQSAATVILALLTLSLEIFGMPQAKAQDTYKVLRPFTWAGAPSGSLSWDTAGNLYGTTERYGLNGYGTVYKLSPKTNGTWAVSFLHLFDSLTDPNGAGPAGGVILDAKGNLYGTTSGGGGYERPSGIGVVFQLVPNAGGTWTEKVLHRFGEDGFEGAYPISGLVFDANGNLYGTASESLPDGCSIVSGCGVVFELSPDQNGSWTYTMLYHFMDGADGGFPSGTPILDKSGNLYGTTKLGGSGFGTVFKLSPDGNGSWTESTLHSFTGGTDGAYPVAGLTLDAAGNLYGTASSDGGSSGCGVVFKMAPGSGGTWTESVLYDFPSEANGCAPEAGVVFDSAGNLYGTTFSGGAYFYRLCSEYCGVVFKLTPGASGTWSETVLHAFEAYGYGPQSAVTLDPKGNLYGTTYFGTGNLGLVFEITP
jgi:uncharacterized repeat protein (TIGR03803 family)